MLKKTSILLPALLLTSSIAFGDTINQPTNQPVPPKTHGAKTLDKIVAVVNDDVIMQSELDQKLDLFQKQIEHSNAKMPSKSILRQQILDSIIDMSLQLQIAKKAGLDVPKEELNKAIDEIAKRNNMTLTTFQEALAHDNINYTDFQKQIHDQILVSKVAQQVLSRNITISDKDIADYKKTHKVSGNEQKAKREAQEGLYRQKMEEGLKKWLKDLRASAYIKIMSN